MTKMGHELLEADEVSLEFSSDTYALRDVKPMTFAINHNGCEATDFEAKILAQKVETTCGFSLEQNGKADVLIFLACTFTKQKEKEFSEYVSRFASESAGMLIVTGCFLDTSEKIDGVNYVRSKDVVTFLSDQFAMSHKAGNLPSKSSITRSYRSIAVSEGCYGSCAFCSIPQARGRHRSRSKEQILNDILSSRSTYKTIKLTGQEFAGYGRDKKSNFAELILHIGRYAPEIKFELSSLNPRWLKWYLVNDKAVLDVLAGPHVTGHVHVPLQSASSRILSLMSRGYDYADYLSVMRYLRAGGVRKLSTDLISGFPSETEMDHLRNLVFLKHNRFSFAQLFMYEARPGTVAADLTQVAKPIKVRRTIELIAMFIAHRISDNRARATIVKDNPSLIGLNTNIDLNSSDVLYDRQSLPVSRRQYLEDCLHSYSTLPEKILLRQVARSVAFSQRIRSISEDSIDRLELSNG